MDKTARMIEVSHGLLAAAVRIGEASLTVKSSLVASEMNKIVDSIIKSASEITASINRGDSDYKALTLNVITTSPAESYDILIARAQAVSAILLVMKSEPSNVVRVELSNIVEAFLWTITNAMNSNHFLTGPRDEN